MSENLNNYMPKKKLALIFTFESRLFMPAQCAGIVKEFDLDIYLTKGVKWINYFTGEAYKGFDIFSNYDAIGVCESMICYQDYIIKAKEHTKKNTMLLFPHSLLGTAYDIGCSTHRKIRNIEGVHGIVPKDWLKFSSMDRVIGGNPSDFIRKNCFVTNTIPMLSNVFECPPSGKELINETCGLISLEGPFTDLHGAVTCAKLHPRSESYKEELFSKNNPNVKMIPKEYENKYRVANAYKKYVIGHSSMIVELSLRSTFYGLDQELAVTRDAYCQTNFLDFEFEYAEGIDLTKRIFLNSIKSEISEFKKCSEISKYYKIMLSEKDNAIGEFGQILSAI